MHFQMSNGGRHGEAFLQRKSKIIMKKNNSNKSFIVFHISSINKLIKAFKGKKKVIR